MKNETSPDIPVIALLALAMIEDGEEVFGALNEATAQGNSKEFLREWTSVVAMLPSRSLAILFKEYKDTMIGINAHMPTGHGVDLEILDVLCAGMSTHDACDPTLH